MAECANRVLFSSWEEIWLSKRVRSSAEAPRCEKVRMALLAIELLAAH
jgi:hypothetical protein